jgi:peptidoglycan/xylan/chitin deacetylase (PgdA/CDA1 family)
LEGEQQAYPILFSLASTCISDEVAGRIAQFVNSGGHVVVGSTAWTRNEAGKPRTSDGRPSFALADALGLQPLDAGLIGTATKNKNAPIVSHIKSSGEMNWLLPKSYKSIGYSHPQHWAKFVEAETGNVLLASGDHPLLVVQPYGKGRFVYHAEFCPLAGFSGYVVDNMVYGIYRKAIEQAFEDRQVPLVRLAPWPWPNVAAFKTRHDHFLHRRAAQIEAENAVRGEWLLRTNQAIGGADWEHVAEMQQGGALIGSHTLNEYTLDSGNYKAAYENVRQSFEDLERHLGKQQRVFVGPGTMANLSSSVRALIDNGVLTTGDMSHGPYPNFALYIDTAEKYGAQARSTLLEIPVSRYPAALRATWLNLIYSHMDSMPLPVIKSTVDLTYELGGVINIYDHIGDASVHLHDVWKYPTTEHLEFYIKHSLSKPNVWRSDPLKIHSWWTERDRVTIHATGVKSENGLLRLTLDVEGNTADRTAVDIRIPAKWKLGRIVTPKISPEDVMTRNRTTKIRVGTRQRIEIELRPE